METSLYQSLKLEIVEFFSLSKDAIHVHIGLTVFMVSLLLISKAKATIKCLLPVILVAICMELLDLYDDQKSLGYLRLSNSVHDIVNTLVWPIIIWLLLRIKYVHEEDL